MLPAIRIVSGYPARTQAEHAFIFLHGLGAGPENIRDTIEAIDLQIGRGMVEYVLPRAPQRPLTVLGGMKTTAWYDVYAWREGSGEDAEGLDAAAAQLEELVSDLLSRGLSRRHIIVGGFSQGGACALHHISRSREPLGGVVALSAYMPLARDWQPVSKDSIQQTPVFIAHGKEDNVLPFAYGDFAQQLLAAAGASVSWHDYEGLGHSVDQRVVHDLKVWLDDRFGLRS